ncbi:toxin-antitoxin system YwqK family antitoxin [Tannerella sp.]|uniref:toxin-antitoxin system YwqK family antitoxin n=1 Tax=Tannerella sp. TaxID=2382127 RepID=UPI0026DB374B|nr:hypothetical protein [Tannerella sp.]MDO4702542.1 hypothetical protein [Tannerella sp.]
MKRRILFSVFLCSILLPMLRAQEVVYQVEEITVLNYGDGCFLFREHNESKKPLEGKHRIIDGYLSEYILAEFKDGMYHGSFQRFKYNKMVEEGMYFEGRKIGVYKVYFSDSKQVKEESLYTEGKLNSIRKTYHVDGSLQSEKGYKMSVEDGIDRKYESQTGKILRDMFYRDGVLEGKQERHIMSNIGNYVKRSNYRNGKLHGPYSEVYTEGEKRTKYV